MGTAAIWTTWRQQWPPWRGGKSKERGRLEGRQGDEDNKFRLGEKVYWGQQVDVFCWRRLVYPLLCVCVCDIVSSISKHACTYRHTAAKMNSTTSYAPEGPTLCSLHSGEKKEKQRYIYLYLSICL